MTPLEDRVSTLFKAAPGDPPTDLDAALLRSRRAGRSARSRLLPILAAGVVIAVAVTTVLIVAHSSGHTSHSSGHTGHSTGHTATPPPSNPQRAARAQARAILRSVPMPPAAHRTDQVPARLGLGAVVTQLSSREEKASALWLAPGTMADTIRFARTHPTTGFEANCTCGGRTVKLVSFLDENTARAIDFVVAPFQSGVAIKVTVIVAYTPHRPAWTYLNDTATTVEVTIKRVRETGSTGGAPTVHRTLHGATARHLAAVANASAPQAPSGCSGPVLVVASTDILIFHDAGRSLTFTMLPSNCPQFIIQASGHQPTYLQSVRLDHAALTELGLPHNYGH